MAYEEYRNSGRCGGKLLYQLALIGIPVNIVENVNFGNAQGITLYGELFATYEWNEENNPIFNFSLQSYKHLPQEELFTAYHQDEISGVTGVVFQFTNPSNFSRLVGQSTLSVSFVYNKKGQAVDMVHFKPIVHKIGGQSSIEAKADALRQAFCTPKRTKR